MPASPTSSSRPWFTPVVLGFVLFFSGACSLVYQTVWLREFRLLFGGAAPAAAAVIAVFMAGLGFGGAWFGARAEKARLPLKFYAFLECAIALSVSLTPWLLSLARQVYIATGGAQAMGLGLATVAQLVITALVLGLPCFLIGGTLPAAMKFAQRAEDDRRSDTALFYGINIGGALTGALLSTFSLLPALGNRSTLMLAVLANALLAVAAGLLSRHTEQAVDSATEPAPSVEETPAAVASPARAPAWFVLGAAFLSGFTFFVAELVWYRVSTPLLGSTVYGFGLVLCVVLLGMGLGGLLYSRVIRRLEPTLSGFTLVSALQALFILLPFAFGDRLAYVALVINESTRGFGFAPVAAGWTGIIAALVFMPSLLSGIQFPLLVSLLGRGNAGVGRELGRAYFWNTVGSISGSLVGGFALIPWLTATATWVAISLAIAAISGVSLLLAQRAREAFRFPAWASVAGIAACLLLASVSDGPTAAWLQTPIGYGRVADYPKTSLTLRQWQQQQRRMRVMAFDGRDANVAVVAKDQCAFMTNGKSDGSALNDAPTQVMFGLVGGALHPREIERCCVVGLGTGSTAGWLAQVPSVSRVDVIEIEERAVDVARHFATVNHDALCHPKVKMIVGDGREVLQTQGPTYDLIASEPSNPYRAGVANLYTREFYQQARQRLAPDGVFCQWLQGYEMDPHTIRLIIATLCAEFAKVEVWNTQSTDFLFVCSPSESAWDLAKVKARLATAPYAAATTRLWRSDSVESFFSHCVAGPMATQVIAEEVGYVNTDDRNELEFAAARNMGRKFDDPLLDTYVFAGRAKLEASATTPPLDRDALAFARLDTYAERADMMLATIDFNAPVRDKLQRKKEMDAWFYAERYPVYLKARGDEPARSIEEKVVVAIATALSGHPRADEAAAKLDNVLPGSAPFCHAMRASLEPNPLAELPHLLACLASLRSQPMVEPRLAQWFNKRLQSYASTIGSKNSAVAQQLYDALAQPMPDHLLRLTRCQVLSHISGALGPRERLKAVEAWGADYPFEAVPLVQRLVTYAEAKHPGTAQARADLDAYLDFGGDVPQDQGAITDALLNSEPGSEGEALRAFVQQKAVAQGAAVPSGSTPIAGVSSAPALSLSR